MYPFNVKGYGGNPVLYYNWIDAPLAPTDVYFALANWGNESWDWFAGTADNYVRLEDMSEYIVFGGAMLVCVVAVGTDESELDWLRLGSLPPVASLTADFHVGMTPLTVQFDASGSTDPDSSIVEYRWDPEGDGAFSQSTGTEPSLSYEYTSAGAFEAAVKVVDNHGVYEVKTVTIDALESVNFSYGAPDVEEEPSAMLIGPDNHLMLFGERGSSQTQIPIRFLQGVAGEG
jgi:PKD repeat protein